MSTPALETQIGGFQPGDIGRIIELHGSYYNQYWGLGTDFEANVATGFAAFIKNFDSDYDGAWFARVDGRLIGGIFIDGDDVQAKGLEEGHARLRYFILDPAYQGHGVGRSLMDAAMAFCQEQHYRVVRLGTFAGLKAARHLYDHYGFRVISEADGLRLTGKPGFTEQILEVHLA